MKLTNKQLRQIIKEELETVLDEGFLDSAIDYGKKAFGFGAEPDEEPAAEPGNQMKQEDIFNMQNFGGGDQAMPSDEDISGDDLNIDKSKLQ